MKHNEEKIKIKRMFFLLRILEFKMKSAINKDIIGIIGTKYLLIPIMSAQKARKAREK
jgi:hypothetical protein